MHAGFFINAKGAAGNRDRDRRLLCILFLRVRAVSARPKKAAKVAGVLTAPISVIGTKRQNRHVRSVVANGGKADIAPRCGIGRY